MQWECREWLFSPVIGSPATKPTGLNGAWLIERATCPTLTTLIRIPHNTPCPLMLFSLQLHRESVSGNVHYPMKHNGPQCYTLSLHQKILRSCRIGIFAKTSTCCFVFARLSCGIPLDNQDHLPWFMCLAYQYDEIGCQHSRQASSTTVDCSTSERLTRYSDVLETISRD